MTSVSVQVKLIVNPDHLPPPDSNRSLAISIERKSPPIGTEGATSYIEVLRTPVNWNGRSVLKLSATTTIRVGETLNMLTHGYPHVNGVPPNISKTHSEIVHREGEIAGKIEVTDFKVERLASRSFEDRIVSFTYLC